MTQDNYWASDGYRYGVMFHDGSVSSRWNGETQAVRAAQYASEVIAVQVVQSGRHDNIRLVRRKPHGTWEEV